MTKRYNSWSSSDVLQTLAALLELGILAWPVIWGWIRKAVSQEKDAYLNYDVDFLLKFYSEEKPVGDGLPYTEVVDLLSLSPEDITMQVVPRKFRLDRGREDSVWRAISDAGYESLLESKRIDKLRDDPTVRLNACVVGQNKCSLTLQKASYLQQARSHLILDYCIQPDNQRLTLRNQLRQEYGAKLPPLSDRRLASTIGIACQLFYREAGKYVPYLVKRVKKVGVMPGGVHCTASGALEWLQDSQSKGFKDFFTADMYREIEEEVGLTRSDIEDLRPVALCREFLRAGKPNVFFAGITSLSRAQLREKRKKAARIVEATKGWPEVERDRFLRSSDFVIAPTAIMRDLFGTGLTIEGAAALYYGARYMMGHSGLPTVKS